MRVTVELTDEQVRDFNRAPLCDAERVLFDAIVAACPKPLKVGDYLKYGTTSYGVLALGRHRGSKWAVVAAGDALPFAVVIFGGWSMSDGSPIVWPE